jgi:hypothetical protein
MDKASWSFPQRSRLSWSFTIAEAVSGFGPGLSGASSRSPGFLHLRFRFGVSADLVGFSPSYPINAGAAPPCALRYVGDAPQADGGRPASLSRW